MTDEEKIERGLRAAALLENGLVKEAFSDLTDRYLRDFAKSDVMDTDAMRKSRLMLQAVSDLRSQLSAYVLEGKNAAALAEQLENL